jgi:hypothetical protein
VTEVYVDVAAASMGSGTAENAATPDPEAVRALRHLAEAGVRVVIVRPDRVEPGAELLDVGDAVVTAVPPQPAAPAWYLTSEIERCRGSSARLRTVLIGGTPPSGSIRRCDTVARDVAAAAMEILAADAMAPGHPASG